MSTSLDGRVAIVTGGGRGIGRAVALRLSGQGAKVVVCDLGATLDGTGSSSGPADDVVSEIRLAGGDAVANTTDITDFDASATIVGQAVEQFGRLDILVNVAGIIRDRMLFNMTEAEFDDVVRVHLKGTFNMSRHAARHWRTVATDSDDFRIINFTSRAGLHGAPTQPNYVAAKMGVVGFTYSCANALQRFGVTTNAVSPTADTRMMDSIPPERRRSVGSADQIAPAVAWLASSDSRWCNGQVLALKGNSVTLYSAPRPLVRLIHESGWDEANLAAAASSAFAELAAQQIGWPMADGDVVEVHVPADR